MANPLTLEQVRFIAANVAPHFGPMFDKPPSRVMTPLEAIAAACDVAASDDALNAAIVSEIYPDTTSDTHPTIIALRAMHIVAITIAAHDHATLLNTVMEELAQHSAVLRGDFGNE